MDVRSATLLGPLLGMWLAVLPSGATWAAPQLKQVSVSNVQFTYAEAGSGDPIVFVHGELQDYRAWSKQVDVFSENYRAIAYSRRNHFPNQVAADGTGDSAAEAHGVDLAAFVSVLGLKNVHVVALGSGAHAALFFAAKYPEMVRTLVVHEPPAVGLLRNSPLGLTMYRTLETQMNPARDAFRAGEMLQGVRIFHDAVHGAGNYDGLDEELQKMMLENAPAQAADAVDKNPPKLFTCEMAREITAPTLVTSGKNSPPMFERIIDELMQCMPNSNDQIVISGAHDAPIDNPRAFNKAVLAFIKKR